MKSLFKVTLLAATMSLAFNALAEDAPKSMPKAPEPVTAEATTPPASKFKNDDQQAAYALGASLGRYLDNSLKQQEELGIKLDREQMLSGVQDAFGDHSKLTDQEIEATLQGFQTRVKAAAQVKLEQEATENAQKGQQFRDKFAQTDGVKSTKSGLMYQVATPGTGDAPKDNDTVVVNYKGTLVDGSEFDSSYTRGEPLSFRLNGVIPGWTEGLKLIKKGGKIKLVIPPDLAYGKNGVPGIPPNSTLVFDVELLDIKPANANDSKAPASAPHAK